jgi:hypothetical protein
VIQRNKEYPTWIINPVMIPTAKPARRFVGWCNSPNKREIPIKSAHIINNHIEPPICNPKTTARDIVDAAWPEGKAYSSYGSGSIIGE